MRIMFVVPEKRERVHICITTQFGMYLDLWKVLVTCRILEREMGAFSSHQIPSYNIAEFVILGLIQNWRSILRNKDSTTFCITLRPWTNNHLSANLASFVPQDQQGGGPRIFTYCHGKHCPQALQNWWHEKRRKQYLSKGHKHMNTNRGMWTNSPEMELSVEVPGVKVLAPNNSWTLPLTMYRRPHLLWINF
jgi:hypothetical protein